MSPAALHDAISTVSPGAWAVGVSGGADSVALLLLLHARADLSLHVVHLDHETRGGESAADAAFVRGLATRLQLPFTIATRSDVEATMAAIPANVSSRYRAARIALFGNVVQRASLSGVVLAHHANDQAETILQRLLRGSGPMGLAGMDLLTDIGGLTIARPLLHTSSGELRDFLALCKQDWREDASNATDAYLRNRLRRFLDSAPATMTDLQALGDACRAVRDWVHVNAPELGETFDVEELGDAPSLLAGEAARRWLVARGVPPDHTSRAVIERLLTMAADSASPARAQFPNRLMIERKRGRITARRLPAADRSGDGGSSGHETRSQPVA